MSEWKYGLNKRTHQQLGAANQSERYKQTETAASRRFVLRNGPNDPSVAFNCLLNYESTVNKHQFAPPRMDRRVGDAASTLTSVFPFDTSASATRGGATLRVLVFQISIVLCCTSVA